MVSKYPSGDEIIGLASQIRDLADTRRSEELQWAKKGAIPDSYLDDPRFGHNVFQGGTTSDYRMLEEGNEWIVQAFQNAIGPEPGLDGAIQGMDAVRNNLWGSSSPMVLSTEADRDGRVSLLVDDSHDTSPVLLKDRMLRKLQSWHGDAAEAFADRFAIPLPGVIANQALMVSALRSALITNRTVYAMARNDLKDLAKATIDALNFKNGSDGPSSQ